MILALRTDKPDAEVYLIHDGNIVAEHTWLAHRALAETLLRVISEQVATQDATLADIMGIICFEGPGSYTGLRIGLSAANALGYSYGVPVIARGGDDWLQQGVTALQSGVQGSVALPVYGGPAFTSAPKK